MNAKVVTSNGKKYLRVNRRRGLSVDALKTTRSELQGLLQKEGIGLVLSDCREIDFSEFNLLEIDTMAKDLKSDVPACKSMAVICQSPVDDNFQHFSNVCYCYGVQLQFFEDVATAEEWLCSR